MKGAPIADEVRRRSDDAVRRLREESRRRVARLRAAGPSRCMLGTMVAMLLFVALEARRMHWIGVSVDASARAATACAMFERRRDEIDVARREKRASAFDDEERRWIDDRALAQAATARRLAREEGCESALPAPRRSPPARRPYVTVSGVWYVD